MSGTLWTGETLAKMTAIFLIQDHVCPFRRAVLLPEEAIGACHPAVRPEITEELRPGDAGLPGPFPLAGQGINTDPDRNRV